uniref:Somatoliberin n=1 Tax=Molossus molossus TaxID=27622 RepID=A0A7J8HH15_MOLMO|nr:growth hormone releasing hormone [Molossus molossus]
MLLWVFFLLVLTLSSGPHFSSPSPTLRVPRYADAIFTNSYRKVWGQLSARKLLQDIMSRQQANKWYWRASWWPCRRNTGIPKDEDSAYVLCCLQPKHNCIQLILFNFDLLFPL